MIMRIFDFFSLDFCFSLVRPVYVCERRGWETSYLSRAYGYRWPWQRTVRRLVVQTRASIEGDSIGGSERLSRRGKSPTFKLGNA